MVQVGDALPQGATCVWRVEFVIVAISPREGCGVTEYLA